MTVEPVMSSNEQDSRFLEVVSAMHAADGVRSTAEAVVRAVLELVPGASEVGVAIAGKGGALTVEVASSEGVRCADERQHQLGEGPFSVLEAGNRVSWGKLTSRQWRRWGTQAAELTGARSVLGVRLVVRHSNVGAIYVYSPEREAFDVDARRIAMLLAEHAAPAIDNAREIHTLRRAVLSRTTTATAVGILMARYRLDDERAFELLRRWSSHRNEKLRLVAAEVLRQQTAHPGADLQPAADAGTSAPTVLPQKQPSRRGRRMVRSAPALRAG